MNYKQEPFETWSLINSNIFLIYKMNNLESFSVLKVHNALHNFWVPEIRLLVVNHWEVL